MLTFKEAIILKLQLGYFQLFGIKITLGDNLSNANHAYNKFAVLLEQKLFRGQFECRIVELCCSCHPVLTHLAEKGLYKNKQTVTPFLNYHQHPRRIVYVIIQRLFCK